MCSYRRIVWIADGYTVEDPCTLAEAVRRAMHLAYTGTDRQRRSAIRNGPLLDEVFAALDDFGRTHDAVLYHPERRGQSSVIFEEIVWRGGRWLDADRGVIAVLYRIDHPDFPPTDPLVDTLVQVDGEWKVSYRRSRVDSTLTSKRSTESTSTPLTRTPDKCRRTDITSDIEASLDRRTGTSPIPARPHPQSKDFTPPSHVFAQGRKVSYRRSYCVKVLVIMEHVGSDVRCPRDPNPEVNEDEAPGSTGRY